MTIYYVNRGTTTAGEPTVTEDPSFALALGRTLGPLAFVTEQTDAGKRIVWTQTHEIRNLGLLQRAVLDRAAAAALG